MLYGSSLGTARDKLPTGQSYRTGDYHAVDAHNRPELVDRAIARLALDGAARVRIEGGEAASATCRSARR